MTMPRSIFRLIPCLMVALCTAAAALAADDPKAKGRDNGSPSTKKSPTTKRSGRTHTITIENNTFSPASLKIDLGDTVVWTNKGDRDHTVNADDKSFRSDNISPDDDFKHTFAKAGTYKYACRYHPREKATITVGK